MEGRNGAHAAAGRGAEPDQDTLGAPSPQEFEAFLILADELHFRRAATRLGRAQSSLSAGIRRLEGKLGTVLFERTSRHVELTAAGEELVPVARRALAALAEARVPAVAGPPPEPSGCFRIGLELPGLVGLTAPVLRAFRARHPGTPMHVKEFSCAHGFFEQRLDVALVRTPLDDERLIVRPIATEARTFMLPPDHRMAEADALSLRDVEDEPFVVAVPQARAARHYWSAHDERGGEPAHVGAEAFTAREFVFGALHLGAIGIAVTSGVTVTREVAFVTAIGLSPNTIGLAVRAHDPRPIVADFVEVVTRMVAACGSMAPTLTAIPDGGAHRAPEPVAASRGARWPRTGSARAGVPAGAGRRR
jgi:DNA-binding transcriptional LysR family regulator